MKDRNDDKDNETAFQTYQRKQAEQQAAKDKLKKKDQDRDAALNTSVNTALEDIVIKKFNEVISRQGLTKDHIEKIKMNNKEAKKPYLKSAPDYETRLKSWRKKEYYDDQINSIVSSAKFTLEQYRKANPPQQPEDGTITDQEKKAIAAVIDKRISSGAKNVAFQYYPEIVSQHQATKSQSKNKEDKAIKHESVKKTM